MTPVQRDTLQVISTYIAEHGCSPSYEDIRIGLGIKSKGRVHAIAAEMKRRGLIDFDHGHSRSIRILDPNDTPDLVAVRLRALHEAADIAVRFGIDGARAAVAIRKHADALGSAP
jgi:SOS-response transcriptional repressor LexA